MISPRRAQRTRSVAAFSFVPSASSVVKRVLLCGLIAAGPGLASADLLGQEKRYGLDVSTPAAEGLDTAKVRRLTERAQETNSSALVILKNGKLVLEWYGLERQPIDAERLTAPVLSMLVGQLIDARKLVLDTVVSAFYPEWKEGRAAKISVRHLLTQTSGLHWQPNPETLESTGDYVEAALSSAIPHEPGSFYVSNSNGLNLLAGVASMAAAARLDEFARNSLFQPLGITEFSWASDAVGSSLGMAGLHLHAVDLAKLGQLMLDGGVWNGKRLISGEWIERSLEPSQLSGHGLLWRLYYARGGLSYFIDRPLLDEWSARGVPEVHVKQFSQMLDTLMVPREYNARLAALFPGSGELQRFRDLLVRHGATAFRYKLGKRIAFYAAGTLGQYIVAYPEHNLVAVRQIHHTKHRGQGDSFSDFMDVVYALTQP